MKRKVAFFDTNLLKKFYGHLSIFLTIFSIVVLFIDDAPLKERLIYPLFLILILIFWYGYLWWDASRLKKINVNIESTTVSIVTGDLFKQNGLKAIPFNEYFDTQVDDEVISKASLNGIFIQDILEETVQSLDDYISNYKFHNENILEKIKLVLKGKVKNIKLEQYACIENTY